MTEIIAEIGQAHDGSLGLLHTYIDAVAEAGVKTIKFQTHIAEAESSSYEPFRKRFSYLDESRQAYWKRVSFSLEQWREIRQHCAERNLEFMSSPFSCAAVDLLEEVGMDRYKIGSGEVGNFLLLQKIGQTGKPIILSNGMSSFAELEAALAFLSRFNNRITLLQCTTQYPTDAGHVGINLITELRERFGLPVGLSDHSGTIFPGLAAATLGAAIVEVHVTFDRRMFGPDSSSSLTLNELAELRRGVEFIDTMLAHPIDKNDTARYRELKQIFGKSLAVNKNLPQGHILQLEDLESKKPAGRGVPASLYEQVLGKRLNRPLQQWDFLQASDYEY